MLTSAQKQSSLRERRKAAGLKRLELWVLPEHESQIRSLSEQLHAKTTGNENDNKTSEQDCIGNA
jgi:hypothetical protein